MQKTSSNIHKNFLDFVYQFYSEMKEHEMIFAYQGLISHHVIKSFAGVVEEMMTSDDEPAKFRKTVHYVMEESLREILHHNAQKKNSASEIPAQPVLLVTRSPEYYHIIAGYTVNQSLNAGLKTLLDGINTAGEEKPVEAKKNQLMNGKPSEREGGHSFINIRRKTGQRLEYHFLPLNETYSFFLLESFISRIRRFKPYGEIQAVILDTSSGLFVLKGQLLNDEGVYWY